MTRKEAIARIKDHMIIHKMNELRAIYISEALDMAIKALEQQPCEDAISRADVKKYLSAPDANGDRVIYESDLDLLPSVTPQPRTGHWINLEKTKYKGQVLPFWCRYGCSKCGGYGEGTFNYCPNCGADMRESEDKE